jgi:hypothetical protein
MKAKNCLRIPLGRAQRPRIQGLRIESKDSANSYRQMGRSRMSLGRLLGEEA